ncbi:hypothetical protein PhaeoP128_03350 [Phaeobacter gallaeciensis]|nr:hypothetical protein PhaeoP129_03349 [Phaeobacter gallaeciensis]ATF24052.1 hypothetical protein PhaeoP128_03350 [Phaeobacter gallaeciensis]
MFLDVRKLSTKMERANRSSSKLRSFGRERYLDQKTLRNTLRLFPMLLNASFVWLRKSRIIALTWKPKLCLQTIKQAPEANG